MNIGIDIDGVLTYLQQEEIEKGTEMCMDNNWNLDCINTEEYRTANAFNWTYEQEDKFWLKYWVQYAENTRVRDKAVEVINKLRKEGNKIIFITARDDWGMPEGYKYSNEEITKMWLEKNNIEYDKLIFCKDLEKLQKCIDNDVDVMIEDSPKNILNISKEIPVMKMHSEYNKNTEGKNITTVYCWYEIYCKLKNN